MNLWTFLDRNLGLLIFFVFLPAIFFGALAAHEIMKARPACVEAKP